MADTSQERREPATQKRRQDARRRGQVFRSSEMTGAFGLLGGIVGLGLGARGAYTALRGYFASQLSGVGSLPPGDLTVQSLGQWFGPAASITLRCFLPVLAGAAALGLLADYAQVGFVFTGEPLAARLDRIDPFAGAKRVFSRRALVELAKSLAKVSIVAVVAYLTVAPQLPRLGGFALLDLEQGFALAGQLAWTVISRAVLALFLVAAVDYFYQRGEYEQSLRMTRDEVRQELKETDGDPQLRGKIRQRQREVARRRMMAAVPKADVVVTNPEHFACALAYRPDEMSAPRLVAKGQDLLALRIRDVARQHRVPVVENKPLARAIYASVEIGDPVPPALYRAVAEVLAFVYRLRGKVA
jgi:flagellar biosynthetic protein FlhB